MSTGMIATGIPFSKLPESYIRPESDRPNSSEVSECENVHIFLIKDLVLPCEYVLNGLVPDPASTDNPELQTVLKIASGETRSVPDSLSGSVTDTLSGSENNKIDNLRRWWDYVRHTDMSSTDGMIAGKDLLIVGYGNVGRSCAAAMKQAGARVIVCEIDPINARQATKDGFQVLPLKDVVSVVDIFVSTIGKKDIIMVDDMRKMKNNAIVCNVSHIDNEIDMIGLKSFPGVEKIDINSQTNMWVFSDTGKGIITYEEGCLMNFSRAAAQRRSVFTNHEVAEHRKEKNSDHICVQVEGPQKPAQEYGAKQRFLECMVMGGY